MIYARAESTARIIADHSDKNGRGEERKIKGTRSSQSVEKSAGKGKCRPTLFATLPSFRKG